MNPDFTEQVEQWMHQLEWLTGAVRQRALLFAKLPVDEKFSRHCRHSPKDWRAIQRRQAQ